MLKFKAGDLIGFGITDENIKNLKDKKPIMVDMSELGLEGKNIMIFYGKTELDLQNELSEFITEDTKYKSDFDN